jgi:hypothetical protein
MSNWTDWKPLPKPDNAREIKAPMGSGVYQVRDADTGKYILFGIGVELQKRMKSLYPAPYGVGTRNNEHKRLYILQNYKHLEYRTMSTLDRATAKKIEDELKSQNNHLFNT